MDLDAEPFVKLLHHVQVSRAPQKPTGSKRDGQPPAGGWAEKWNMNGTPGK
jgi:hypothetical protein